jgi:hypothetical protein
MYKEYKIIEYYTLPTENEVNAYFLNKDRLPSQEELEDRAKSSLEKTVNEYLSYGWKLQGSINSVIKGEWSYTNLQTIKIICYSQAIYIDEDYYDWNKNIEEKTRMGLEAEKWIQERKRKEEEEEDMRIIKEEDMRRKEEKMKEKKFELFLIVCVICMFILLRLSDLLRGR